jgi:hypothetical protein
VFLPAAAILFATLPTVSHNSGDSLELADHLHPLATIDSVTSPLRISGVEAAQSALGAFTDAGVIRILICEVRHIDKPEAAWLVDALGSMTSHGRKLDTFRLAIRDGSDWDGETCIAGEQLAFIAIAADTGADSVWFPFPGPGWTPVRGEPAFSDARYAYMYLQWREEFESLFLRYPRGILETGSAILEGSH